jgi:starch-binding outer membrane protein, SusD/RagB family
LDDIINNGVTAGGQAFQLEGNYGNIFRVSTEANSRESLFAYEATAEDGSIGNGNYENTLNQPHGGTSLTTCCGFFQPTQYFVNAFKTSAGLPMLATFNDTDLLNDEGLASSSPFTPDATTPLDPRLDHSVGRRGIPYLDWGLHPGNNWIRQVSNGGPYSPKKNVPTAAELGTNAAGVVDWGFASTAQNVHIIRFGDVLLMSAEVEAELNNLANATTRVNAVRVRAAASNLAGSPAAYSVSNYATFASQAAALDAIRFERMLELGMEGHRMFDLVRWHFLSAGSKTVRSFDAVAYLNSYLTEEKTKRNHLSAATFTAKYAFMPLPEAVVTQATKNGVKTLDQSTDWGGTRVFSIND